MRRMRISTLLADPRNSFIFSSASCHHDGRRLARRRHQTTAAIPCAGLCLVEPQPSLRFARFCRHTHQAFSLFSSNANGAGYCTNRRRNWTRPLGRSDRRGLALPSPRLSAKVREATVAPSRGGRLRNEANNRLNGLEWGGGSTRRWAQTTTELGKGGTCVCP
ncbi:hypothetical protein V8C35DRAFT_317434 [Trichoderma chlorosporum]